MTELCNIGGAAAPVGFRPIRMAFDGAALRHNLGIAKQHAGPARLWSVVKANAYGHGLMRAVDALVDVADGFALIELENAIALRESGIRQPLLMLEGFYSPDQLPLFAEYGLTTVLHSLDQIRVLCAQSLPVQLPVYLKLNTGMNRLGLVENEMPEALERLAQARCVSSITLMTHFADADGKQGVAGQLAKLNAMRAGRPEPISIANSAALLRYPEAVGDWARPGIMLYGGSPFPDQQSAAKLGLRPVMTFSSELIAVREIAPGDQIGYGGTFTALRPMKIGVVACGYADGYPRHAPTGTPILVDGVRTRTLGRVSMDKLCVDLTPVPKAQNGTPVTLWGEGLPADDVATAAGTISYELFCAITARVPVVCTDD